MYRVLQLAFPNCNVSDRFRSRRFAIYNTISAPDIRLRSFIDIVDSILLIPFVFVGLHIANRCEVYQ